MHMKNSAIFKETSLVFPSRKMVQILEKLCNKTGKYTGEGLNDHDDHFTCYMDIDVIMITKNSLKPCLIESIESIIKNINLNKLIIIDAFSNDGTIDLLNKYRKYNFLVDIK